MDAPGYAVRVSGIQRTMKSPVMYVAGLWRYPVKSLAGEPLDGAFLERTGVPADRRVLVMGPEGVRTARKHHRLLGLQGGLGADGRPTIDGYAWDSRQALALVRNAAGADAWLEACEPGEGVDILPLLVATDGGDTYTYDEVRTGLEQAGFRRIGLLRKGEHMDGLVEAFKPL